MAEQRAENYTVSDEERAEIRAIIESGEGTLLDLLDEVKSAALDAAPVGTFVVVKPMLEAVVRTWQEVDVQILIDSIAHEDWCCAKGCVGGHHGTACPGCTCLVSVFQRAADARYTPTSADRP